MNKSVTIGIDLGTTHSLCSVFQDGQPKLIPNAHGQYLTPSVVGALKDDRIIVGQPAKEFAIQHPERCADCFKRNMGTDHRVEIGPYALTSPELSSIVLKSLKEDAENFLGVKVFEAVITVPAYFNDNQRKATKIAAEIAKLKVARIVNEPTAAALTYGFHESEADKKLLVFDLGGGTFDVTLMEIFEGSLEILATAGENFLGGEDFTTKLASHMLSGLGQHLEIAELHTPLMVARLMAECEKAKRQLTDTESARIRIPDERGEFSETSKTVTIDRSEFRQITRDLVARLEHPVKKILRDTNFHPSDIEEVILVGGSTRMPLVVDYAREYFGKEPLIKFDPDQVVANGAAIQSALIEDDLAVEDMVMTDVCPHTLGVHIVKEFNGQIKDGYYLPVIHRNTTIPVCRENAFATVHPNQTEVKVEVYQGESRRVDGNLKLGELKVGGLPYAANCLEVEIRFTYDINGILDVEAYVPELDKKFNTVLTNNVKTLSQSEIDEAVERLQELKYFPRDKAENQRLLLFAERVVAEVSSVFRQDVEYSIDYYEEALRSNDRENFETVKEHLMGQLRQAGFPYESIDGPN